MYFVSVAQGNVLSHSMLVSALNRISSFQAHVLQVAHIAALFNSAKITALAWTHLLLLDLFVARYVL